MFCNSIEEYSIQYLENELDAREKKLFIKHINNCKRCRMMFNIISRNYHPKAKIRQENPSISAKINTLLDKSRYPVSKTGVSCTKRRIIFISAIIILSVFATANAKTIYKTYKELANSMFVDKALLNISGIKHTGIYSDEEYVKSIYEGYEDEINSHIADMDTAEISRLEYDVDGKTFRIQIAKGIEGNFILYGFDGYSIYENDFSRKYSMSMYEGILSNTEKYQSIDELLSAAGICPVPGYIPQGFNLMETSLSYVNQNSKTLDRVGLIFLRDEGEFLSIALTRDKVAVDNVGIPDELVKAAGLNLSKNADAANADDTDNQNKADVQGDISEMLDINEYQAVYLEQNLENPLSKGVYKTSRSINIFLGDGAKLPILRIQSLYLEKEEIIKIAENITIENLSENQIKADEYFKGIEDEKILAFIDNYLNNIKAGKTEFRIKVDEDTEFYRWSHNDTYYILYRNVDVTKVNSYIQFPFNLDIDFLKKFEHASVQILGWPYANEKSYWCGFANNNNVSFSIHVDRYRNIKSDLSLTDKLIAAMSGYRGNIKPLFSKSGQLYYLVGSSESSWSLNTMYGVNGQAIKYDFSIEKKILQDEGAVMEFINSLE